MFFALAILLVLHFRMPVSRRVCADVGTDTVSGRSPQAFRRFTM